MGWANSAPTDINATNLTISENSAIGTVIGEFNATDPDGDTNITFTLVPPLPSDLNFPLVGCIGYIDHYPFKWFGQSMVGQKWKWKPCGSRYWVIKNHLLVQ